jgi:hypothetical protein
MHRIIEYPGLSTSYPEAPNGQIQVQESWDSEFDTLMTTPDVRQEPE